MMEQETIYGNLPLIETDRLTLRKLKAEDTPAIYTYGSDEEVSKYCMWDTHQSLADSKAFIDYALYGYNNKEIGLWGIVVKEDKKLIGVIDFVSWQTEHRTAEIGYVLAQEYWSKGLMTEAVKAVIQFGFAEMDLIRIQAKCFTENTGSAKIMQRGCVTYEGTKRKASFLKGKH